MLEEMTLVWMRQMLGLPDHLIGRLTQRPAIATFLALDAARGGGQENKNVPRTCRPTHVCWLYTSREAHPWIQQVALLARSGTRRRAPLSIPIRRCVCMCLASRKLSRRTAHAGWLPFAVVATIGTAATGAIDPVSRLASLCEQEHLWLHVDATTIGVFALDTGQALDTFRLCA